MQRPIINQREVHVWQIRLDDAGWDAFAAILSRDEQEKAARFRTPRLQQNYKRSRSALRIVLGRYSSQYPQGIVFGYGEFGKPEMPGHALHFNLSHSGDIALIALSSHPIGVDVEWTEKERISIDDLADMVCHPIERAALALLTDAVQRRKKFYRIWTQKEAYCKALGLGLQHPMVQVRLEAMSSPDISQVRDESGDHAASFYVHDLDFLDGYAGSVCVPFPDARICLFTDDVRSNLTA